MNEDPETDDFCPSYYPTLAVSMAESVPRRNTEEAMQEGCLREVGGGVELMGAGEAWVEGMCNCLERFVEDWFRHK